MDWPKGIKRDDLDVLLKEAWLAGYQCHSLGYIPIRGVHLITWRTIWISNERGQEIGCYIWHPHEREWEWRSLSL